MPTLRELQKRLESAETIKQLSGAMRSAATAKYAKLSAALDSYSPYAAALRSLADRSGGAADARAFADCAAVADVADGVAADVVGAEGAEGDAPALCLLVSGNRGLCGGYHQQLFAFFADYVKDKNVRVVTCGKKALDFCRVRKIPVEASFSLSDVPDFAKAKEIAGYARDMYSSGEVSEVVVCYQRFVNMLRSEPTAKVVLGASGGAKQSADDGEIFIPERKSVASQIEPFVLASGMYDVLLSAATGVQAATLVAMRSAYENADSSISSLVIMINRLRQAAVTASVLETAIEVKE